MAASALLRIRKPAFVSRLTVLVHRRSNPQRFNHTFTDSDLEVELERELGPETLPFQEAELERKLGLGNLPFQVQVDRGKWRRVDARALGLHRGMISSSSWAVLRILKGEGFEAYLVGGCVRDLILHRTPKDFDVITTAQLDQIKEKFHRCMIVGQRFPVCRVLIKGSVVEVSSFETVAQNDEEDRVVTSQIPSGCDEKDFALWRNSVRRDFTVNSLFLDPFVFKVYDYANGMEDLRFLKLRTLVPAELSFKEDCARILRGLRIAARLGLSLSKETESAIWKLSSSIESLGKGRILMELNYMLSYGAAEASLHLLRRYKLLDILLPHHAAYLDKQVSNQVAQRSAMFLELFSHLDNLVTCDRPCNTALWAGLLSFHLSLVNNPQNALTVMAFASTLYHGRWTEGVKTARKQHQLQADFVPEIAGSSESLSDEELASKVANLAALVQESISALIGKESSVESRDALIETESSVESGGSLLQCSGLVCIPNRIAESIFEIFEVLVNDIRSYEDERESYEIDYFLLRKGNVSETRFVLGKVIMETMCGEVFHNGRKDVDEINMANICEEEKKSDYIDEVSDLYLSDVIKNTTVVETNSQEKPSVFGGQQKEGAQRLELVDQCHHSEESEQKQQTVEKHNCLGLIKKHLEGITGKLYKTLKETKEAIYGKCHFSEYRQEMAEKDDCLEMVKKNLDLVKGKHHKSHLEERRKQAQIDNEPKSQVYKVREETWQSKKTEDQKSILACADVIKQKLVPKKEEKQGQTALNAEVEENETKKFEDENSVLALSDFIKAKLIPREKEKQGQSAEVGEVVNKFEYEKSVMTLQDMIEKKMVKRGEVLSPCEAEQKEEVAEGPKLAGKDCHHSEQKPEVVEIDSCFDMAMKYLDVWSETESHSVPPKSDLLQKKESKSSVKGENEKRQARKKLKTEKHSGDFADRKDRRKLSSLF